MSRRRAHARRDDRGAAAVELALILPILLVLVMGIVQFGLTFSQWLEMEHAAREGARWGSLGYASSVIKAKVREDAPGLSPALTDAQISVMPADPLSHPGESVTVQISYDSPIFPVIGPAMGKSGATWPLKASAVDRIE